MWEGSGRTLCAPSRFAHSAGDEGEDLLGKRDNNAARDGEHAVGALGGVVALEGQAQLEDVYKRQVISTGIVCIGLLIFNWQMGLALLWVAPISFAIVILSRKWQEKLSKKHMNARLELAEGIQECLETVQDIKACNLEDGYLRKLDAKMDAAEKAQISSEMTTALSLIHISGPLTR